MGIYIYGREWITYDIFTTIAWTYIDYIRWFFYFYIFYLVDCPWLDSDSITFSVNHSFTLWYIYSYGILSSNNPVEMTWVFSIVFPWVIAWWFFQFVKLSTFTNQTKLNLNFPCFFLRGFLTVCPNSYGAFPWKGDSHGFPIRCWFCSSSVRRSTSMRHLWSLETRQLPSMDMLRPPNKPIRVGFGNAWSKPWVSHSVNIKIDGI